MESFPNPATDPGRHNEAAGSAPGPSSLGLLCVIVNPAADNGATAGFWRRTRERLRAAGLEFVEMSTEGPGHASALARQAGEKGYGVVLYVGGDGTANEVANGILSLPTLARPTLAALPRGTGGDFPHNMGMQAGTDAALARLLRPQERVVDVVAASYTGFDGDPAHRFFINLADVGIGGFVAERVNRTTKAFGGFASFLWATLATFSTMRKPIVALTVDGVLRYEGPITSVGAANGARFGGGMILAPQAVPDDGLLDFTVIGDITRTELARNLPKLYRGTILTHPKVESWQGTHGVIATAEPAPVEMDGEHTGTTPFEVWVEPGALRILV
jgi:diacylglycerol kinase (ATP)